MRISLKAPRHWSIGLKLKSFAMMTSLMALALAFAGFALYQYFTERTHLVASVQTMARLLADNSTAAIVFNRPDDATTTLATLSGQPNVLAAGIYNDQGKLLATYLAPAGPDRPVAGAKDFSFPATPAGPGHAFVRGAMHMYVPVELDDKVVGTLYICASLDELYVDLRKFALAAPVIFAIAAAAGLLSAAHLHRYISAPAVALARISRRVSLERDYTLRAPKAGDDELGLLADAFNDMLEGIRQRDEQIHGHLLEVQSARDLLEKRVEDRTADLTRANAELQAEMGRRRDAEHKREQMQANLMEASRRAGMADVATGVLHNVGNVLNSINVSAQIVQDAVKTSRLVMLARATDLLQQHSADLSTFLTSDDRGRQLPAFLSKLSATLQEEQASLLGELDSLGSNVNHVREIVSMQQSLARVAGVSADVPLGEILEDALKINQAGLARHRVTIRREYDPALVIHTDRHKLLQILINLISNAKYAVNGTSGDVRDVTVRAACLPDGMLRIDVIDTGVGIDAATLDRLFNFGFTTKKDGHGFGLHTSALAAKELGGTLHAASDGPGKGATFTLTLPVTKEVPAHA
jgi:signal transduction histidine kinase